MGKKRNRSESFTKSCTTDSGKKSDDWDSQEEYDIEAGLSKLHNGVRCSARVIEKQEKLRRELSPAKQQAHAVDPSHQIQNNVQSSSCQAQAQASVNANSITPCTEPASGCGSGEVMLMPGMPDSYWDRDPSSPPTHSEFKDSGIETYSSCRGQEEKRKKRNWEVWSQDDKLHFFEALNEFGKDFDAIQNHLATKLKSRSRLTTTTALSAANFVPKNKDQVRHFYYRTWHKIAKHLKFPKDMKRANMEIYGLVNYGELRKKQRVLNGKNAAKLSELMEKGMTTIKVRGKTFRIKTPVCRAIKRMNLLDDEHSRVPCKIGLDLTANDQRAWATVQAVAHNPRVSAQVPPQRTLSSVIAHFEERWKTPADRLKDQLVHTFGKQRRIPRLRFIPHSEHEQEARTPIFKMSECTNSAMISLRSYTEKVLQKPEPDSNSNPHLSLKIRRKQSHSQSQSGNASEPEPEFELSDADKGQLNSDVDTEDKEKEAETKAQEHCLNCPNANTSEYVLSAVDDDADDKKSAAENSCVCSPASKLMRDRESEDIVGHIWDDEAIRRGWNASEAGLMTVGELYLILGRCQRLSFRYAWDCEEHGDTEPKLIDKLVEVARALRKRKSMRTKSHSQGNYAYAYAASAGSGVTLNQCVKCGHQNQYPYDQYAGGAHGTAPPPIPSSTELASESAPDIQVLNFTHQQKTTASDLQQNYIYTNAYVNPSTSTTSTDASAQPSAEKSVIEPPPKPFMDLTRGNRRINRLTTNSRRMFGPGQVQRHSFSFHQGAQQQQQPQPFSEGGTSTGTDPGQLSITSSELEHLLHDNGKTGDKADADSDNTFSLSSFMDISLPESTRLVADDVSLNVDKLLDDSTNTIDKCCGSGSASGLETPKRAILFNQGTVDEPIEPTELSFTNLLTPFETDARPP